MRVRWCVRLCDTDSHRDGCVCSWWTTCWTLPERHRIWASPQQSISRSAWPPLLVPPVSRTLSLSRSLALAHRVSVRVQCCSPWRSSASCARWWSVGSRRRATWRRPSLSSSARRASPAHTLSPSTRPGPPSCLVRAVLLFFGLTSRASTTPTTTQGALRQGGGDDRPVGALAIPGRSGQAHGKGPVSLQLTGGQKERKRKTKRKERRGQERRCLVYLDSQESFLSHTHQPGLAPDLVWTSNHEMNERRARESALFLGTRAAPWRDSGNGRRGAAPLNFARIRQLASSFFAGVPVHAAWCFEHKTQKRRFSSSLSLQPSPCTTRRTSYSTPHHIPPSLLLSSLPLRLLHNPPRGPNTQKQR